MSIVYYSIFTYYNFHCDTKDENETQNMRLYEKILLRVSIMSINYLWALVDEHKLSRIVDEC